MPEESKPERDDEGWARIREALRFRPNRAHFVVGLLCLSLGFAAAVQVQSTQSDALAGARSTDLVRILDDLSEQRERLATEATALQATLDQLASGADQAGAAREAAQQRLTYLGILAGTIPAEGPGIVITVADTQGAVQAADLLDAVQELRDAGAEAIQINQVRVVGSTSLIDTADGLVVDGEVVAPTYEVRAIGNPETMSSALAIPGGVIERLNGIDAAPLITESAELRIDALKPPPQSEYARPA